MLGWIFFGLLIIWYFLSIMHCHRKRVHLRSYITYLLLNDDIREHHKKEFEEWIQRSNVNNASELFHRAQDIVENAAQYLGQGGSILAAGAMIWKVKQGE